jgi:hypothetical protein
MDFVGYDTNDYRASFNRPRSAIHVGNLYAVTWWKATAASKCWQQPRGGGHARAEASTELNRSGESAGSIWA